MRLRFNPSGTHVHKGVLKVEFDFIPDSTDKTYPLQHVFVVDETSKEFLRGYKGKTTPDGDPVNQDDYNAWEESLPHVWRTNPALCWFMPIPETFQVPDLETYLSNLLNKDTVATIDHYLTLPDSAHYISPYTRSKPKFTDKKIITTDVESLIVAINDKLKVFVERPLENDGNIEPVVKSSITVGSAAVNQNSTQDIYNVYYYTAIDYNLAANATGTIDTVKAWWNTAGAGTSAKAGSFANTEATTFVCNDAESIGTDLVAGSEQTYAGLSFAITIGDYIGVDGRAAVTLKLERGIFGGIGSYYAEGQYCDPSDSFNFTLKGATSILSLNGTGTESGGGGTTTVVTCNLTEAYAIQVSSSGLRLLSWTRDSTPVLVNALASPSRNATWGRTGSADVNITASGSRLVEWAVSSATIIQASVSALVGKAYQVASDIAVNIATTASRLVESVRTSPVIINIQTLPTRLVEWVVSSLNEIKASISAVVAYVSSGVVITALVEISMSVVGTFTRKWLKIFSKIVRALGFTRKTDDVFEFTSSTTSPLFIGSTIAMPLDIESDIDRPLIITSSLQAR